MVTLEQGTRPRRVVNVQLYSFFNLNARWGGISTPRPGHFTPREICSTHCIRRLGGPQVPVWMGAENRTSNGIRSPDRSARSESLYRLSYRGPNNSLVQTLRVCAATDNLFRTFRHTVAQLMQGAGQEDADCKNV